MNVTELEFDDASPGSLIDALLASERQLRSAEARQARVLGALCHSAWDCSSEVSAAMRWSSATTDNRLREAGLLSSRFPETLSALARGEVSWVQAAALAKITSNLDDDKARAVQDRVLPRISEQVPATTRAALRRAVIDVDPRGAAERHAVAATRRRVELRAEDDGMATLSLHTTAPTARAILTTVDQHCANPAKDDPRTADQRRADVFAELLLSSVGVRAGAARQGVEIPALVTVIVPLDTLIGASESPGELVGDGPITAAEARELACGQDVIWQRLITTPDGMAVYADPTKYRPTAATRRYVQALNRTCTFPGCRMPAIRSDLDHMESFDHENPECGGPTSCDNLHPVCRHHHNEKTNGNWHVERIDDVVVWTSLVTGIAYASRPDPYPVGRTAAAT